MKEEQHIKERFFRALYNFLTLYDAELEIDWNDEKIKFTINSSGKHNEPCVVTDMVEYNKYIK